jgi:hypothetical protein
MARNVSVHGLDDSTLFWNELVVNNTLTTEESLHITFSMKSMA